MKASQLETRPFGRVARDPEQMPEGFESFALEVTDRHLAWALYIRLLVTGSHKAPVGQMTVSLLSRDHTTHLVHRERFGPKAIAVDPERFGLGLGETLLGEGRANGIAHLPNHTLHFDMAFSDTCPAMGILPAAWMYSSSLIALKHALVHPSARVDLGKIEIWEGVGRDAPRREVCLQGASVMLTHSWGHALRPTALWLRCARFEEAAVGACLEVYMGLWAAGPFKPDAHLALLRLDGETHRFTSIADFFRKPVPTRENALSITFAGPSGALKLHASWEGRGTEVAGVGAASAGVHHAFVKVTATFAPKRGPKRTLESQQGTLTLHAQLPEQA